MTAAKAAPEFMPNTATETAIASSKLLLAAVKESGEVTLRMVGTLTSGRSYDAEDTVYITEYSGR